MILLLPVYIVLIGLLAFTALEHWTLATGRAPYTTHTRRLIARFPGWSIAVLFFGAGALGFLAAHFFICG